MATVVEAVPNSDFAMPRLTTRAGTIVDRNRSKFACNNPGVTYGASGATGASLQSTIVFDLMDARRMLLTRNLIITGNFIPAFYKKWNTTTNLVADALKYPHGTGPSIDQSLQALISRVRIGTQQGHVIEEIFSYGLYANILESYAETDAHKEFSSIDHSSLRWQSELPFHKGTKCEWIDNPRHHYDGNSRLTDNIGKLNPQSLLRVDDYTTISGMNTQNNQARAIVISLHHSSFLNSVGVLPLNLFNNALRIEIELMDPRYCFYNNHMGLPPVFALGTEADTGASVLANSAGFGMLWSVISPGMFTSLLAAGALDQNVERSIPTGGEFWLLARDGRPVTIVYAGLSAGLAANNSTVIMYTEAAAVNTAVATCSDIGAEVRALQQIYGLPPAGGNGTFGALRPYAAYTYTDDGGNVVSVTADYQVAGAANVKKLFNQIWVIPRNAAPFQFARSNTSPSMALAPQNAASNVAFANFAPQWQYAIEKPELLVDLVLPSDPVRSAYRTAFMQPSGITFPFKRIMYQNFISSSPPSTGWQQFQINARVKSLRSIICVMTDQLWNSTAGGIDYSVYNLPSMSSFQAHGVSQAYLQVGGVQFPQHRILDDTSMIMQNHLPELMTTLGAAIGSNGAIPTFSVAHLHREGRNYGKAGPYNGNEGGQICPWVTDQTLSRGLTQTPDVRTGNVALPNSGVTAATSVSSYIDTSKFILAFNTCKVDNDFMSGIDVSAAGSMVLNLFMNTWGVRRYVLHIFAICDAGFSLQESQSVVRM